MGGGQEGESLGNNGDTLETMGGDPGLMTRGCPQRVYPEIMLPTRHGGWACVLGSPSLDMGYPRGWTAVPGSSGEGLVFREELSCQHPAAERKGASLVRRGSGGTRPHPQIPLQLLT